MNSWHEAALKLDELYSRDRPVARSQIKNQPQLLVLDGTRYNFFPIRRLADGIAGREMDAPKSHAQEVQRYRQQLRSLGFREIVEGDSEHGDLLNRLKDFMREKFQDRPSPSTKTFWVPNRGIQEAVLDAFKTFDDHGLPDGFAEARSWFVSHPTTDVPYPAKAIWGIATNKKGSEFISHQARDGLRKAGFECADLSSIPATEQLHEQLEEGATHQSVRSRRERNPVARALCIEHYRSRNDGRLVCIVCSFNFAEVYGKLGDGFIHVHHLNPISEAKASRVVSPAVDLVPVCPNCHSMIHRGGENRSVAKLLEVLFENKDDVD